ncbi:hypothetical protein [Candidatus Nitrospira allomarina]|uniref:Uncharacterized protein n=1 Tax=Candidatus Nitrospira allomarina TaxID=3020900 RepID=A0AA96GHI7_9BACT|nr:hypothetical protein [Candidatus Nitrospira allomarina]WNM58983.1 hypothetical protein PP769_04230 [Candidatus Nitrospira allomarina]
MNRKLCAIYVIGSVFLGSTLALGNPDMLPNHPGYPMGDAKSPVTGQSVANDPGQTQPSRDESLQQAAGFHDAHAMNPGKEERPNIVSPGALKSMDTKSNSTK